jgi:hypothetical protein
VLRSGTSGHKMEEISVLNQRLIDHFGLDTSTGQPMFRIVWANDQTEKRLVNTLDSGIQLLYPVVREVKKYSYIRDTYVLENLVIIPEFQREELAGLKLSYEPVWAYKDKDDNPLPPLWEPTKLIIDTLHAAMGKTSLKKYVDPENAETRELRIEKMHEELFGNENETTDALAYGEGIVVPSNYKVN